MDRFPTCRVAEIELQIQPSESSDSANENESEHVIFFYLEKSRQENDEGSADGFIR